PPRRRPKRPTPRGRTPRSVPRWTPISHDPRDGPPPTAAGRLRRPPGRLLLLIRSPIPGPSRPRRGPEEPEIGLARPVGRDQNTGRAGRRGRRVPKPGGGAVETACPRVGEGTRAGEGQRLDRPDPRVGIGRQAERRGRRRREDGGGD